MAHLQASGADVVAYDELLFWRDKWETIRIPDPRTPYFDRPSKRDVSEAWIFRNKGQATPGTSFCYWRKTWERKPFPDAPRIIAGKNVGTSEDYQWCQGLNVARVSGIPQSEMLNYMDSKDLSPRLICNNTRWKFDAPTIIWKRQ